MSRFLNSLLTFLFRRSEWRFKRLLKKYALYPLSYGQNLTVGQRVLRQIYIDCYPKLREFPAEDQFREWGAKYLPTKMVDDEEVFTIDRCNLLPTSNPSTESVDALKKYDLIR